jgi:two-component system phosphate regulon response regulator PhoB
MKLTTILIIEDDPEISEMVATYLEADGHQVIRAPDGATGLDAAVSRHPDLILLDLMLPGISGREICRNLRKNRATAEIPIIMMTSCSDEIDRVTGFEIGADDYVVKPFSVRELSLRIQAVLRRNRGATAEVIPAGRPSLLIDPEKCAVSVYGRNYSLTHIEYRLLTILAEYPDIAQSRESLRHQIWGEASDVNLRIIDAHVKRLRRKLEDAGTLVKTVHGSGYKLRSAGE